MHHHLKSEAGFFCGHLDFPSVDLSLKIEIVNSLLKKLVRKGIIDATLDNSNIKDLKYLEERFKAGDKMISLDPNDGIYPGHPFMYLSFTDRAHWIDRHGEVIRDFKSEERKLVQIYSEDNVIPKNGSGAALKYYMFVKRTLDKENEKKRLSGLLLVGDVPQLLINFPSRDLKQSFSEHLDLDFKDLQSKTPSFLKCESNPFILLNDSFTSRNLEIVKNKGIRNILTILDFSKSQHHRNHILTFNRNGIISDLKCRAYLVISFRNNLIRIKENLNDINKRLFNLRDNQPKRSVLISRVDLDLYNPDSPEVITWLEDRSIYASVKALHSLTHSLDSELIDLSFFNKFRFYQLLSISITVELQEAILNEILNGTNELIGGFQGIKNLPLGEEATGQIISHLRDILLKVFKVLSPRIVGASYDGIVVPRFVLSNSQFLLQLPPELVSKFRGWDTIGETSDRLAILDYLDLDRPLNIFNVQRRFQKADMFFVSAFFRKYYNKNRVKLYENLLESYSEDHYPLRKSLHPFEEASKQSLEKKLQLKEFRDPVIVDSLDISNDIDDENENAKQKFEIVTDKGRTVVSSGEKILSKDKNGWRVLTFESLFEKLKYKNLGDVEIVDHSEVKRQLSKGKQIKVYNWRKGLRKKVSEMGGEVVYNSLTEYSEVRGGTMVSQSWFEKDWLSEDDTDQSIPKSRANLLAIGQFLSLSQETLLTIVRTNLVLRLDNADVNRSILHLIRDLLDLILSSRSSEINIELITDTFVNSPSYRNSLAIFNQYISVTNTSTEGYSEVKKFFEECISKIEYKRIKLIRPL